MSKSLRNKIISLMIFFISLLIASFIRDFASQKIKNRSNRFYTYITGRIADNYKNFLTENYYNLKNFIFLSELRKGLCKESLGKLYHQFRNDSVYDHLDKFIFVEYYNDSVKTWLVNEKVKQIQNFSMDIPSTEGIYYDEKRKALYYNYVRDSKNIFVYLKSDNIVNRISNRQQRSLLNFKILVSDSNSIFTSGVLDEKNSGLIKLRSVNTDFQFLFSKKENFLRLTNSNRAEFLFVIVLLIGSVISILFYFYLNGNELRKKIYKEFNHNEKRLLNFYQIISQDSKNIFNRIESILEFICFELFLELGIVSKIENDVYEVFVKNPSFVDIEGGFKFNFDDTYCKYTVKKDDFFTIVKSNESEYTDEVSAKDFGFRTYIGFPLKIDNKLFGTICFVGRKSREKDFSNFERNLIKLSAEWISASLKNYYMGKENEENFQNFQKIFNLSKSGILIHDGKKILEINDGLCEISGYSKDELIGSSIYKSVHKDDFDYVKHKIENDYIGNYEARAVRADGSEYIMDVNVQNFVYKNKQTRLVFIQDITFQRNYEAALNESKQFLLEILNSISDSISVHDNQGNTVIANKSYYELEISNKDLLHIIHNPDSEEYICSDQAKKRTYHSKKTRLETESGKIYYVTISRDITDITKAEKNLLESEQLFRNVIESLNEGLLLVDKDGFIIYGNNQLENITGYRSEEITFQNSYELFFEEEELKINDLLKDHQIKKRELQIKQKSNKNIWVELSLIPIREADGQEIGLLMAMIDIQTRKEAELELLKSLKEKEFLLKEIHHRVKNNLQIISSLLNLQRNYINEPIYQGLFQESQNRVKSMALIHEKLYQNEYFSQIDIQHYIYSLTSNLKNSYSSESHSIQFKFDIDNIFLSIDQAIPCGLILNELISNSIKYAFQNQEDGIIDISLKLIEKNKVLLTIADNGKGLPKNFDILKSESLGLKIVKTLAEQIDANLNIMTENGVKVALEFLYETIEEVDVIA